MVTGCTDGIGKAFCEELAKKKINLVLIRCVYRAHANLASGVAVSAPGQREADASMTRGQGPPTGKAHRRAHRRRAALTGGAAPLQPY